MKIAWIGFTVVCLTIGIVACTHKAEVPNPVTTAADSTNKGNNNNTNTGGNAGNSNIDTGICFQRDILPIFISNCAKGGCHDAATRADGYQFTDYNSIIRKKFVAGNADKTELYEKIVSTRSDDRMPQPPNPPLTAAQISLIRRWINEGAQNTTNCSSGCDSNNFTYSAAIKPMTDQYCKGCHNAASPSGNYAFDSYAGLKKVVDNGRLLGAIKHQSGYTFMPQGGNKLSDCQILQFEKWIANGAQNN